MTLLGEREVSVLSTTAMKTAFEALGPAFERETGYRLKLAFGPSLQLEKRLNEGEGAVAWLPRDREGGPSGVVAVRANLEQFVAILLRGGDVAARLSRGQGAVQRTEAVRLLLQCRGKFRQRGSGLVTT